MLVVGIDAEFEHAAVGRGRSKRSRTESFDRRRHRNNATAPAAPDRCRRWPVRRSCSLNKRDVGGRRLDQHRRREVARIAGMEGGEFERLVGEAGARAELIGIDILPHLVEAQRRN